MMRVGVSWRQARSDAKGRRDYATADAIRTGLEAHGIKITDSSRSWIANDGRKGNTSGPDFFSVAGTPFAPGYAPPGGAAPGGYGAPPPSYGAPPAPYGYPGYGYPAPPPPAPPGGGSSQPAAPGMLSTDAIHAKLTEREGARVARDYPRSDSMRDELRALGPCSRRSTLAHLARDPP